MALTRGQEINYKNLNNAFVSSVGGGHLIGDYDISGVLTSGHHILDINGIEVNILGSGDRISYIDFHSDNVHTDYSFRILREATENGNAVITNQGLGDIKIISEGASNIEISTNNTAKFKIDSAGTVHILAENQNALNFAAISNYYIGFSSSQPVVNFDDGDYIIYDRSSNALEFKINNSSIILADASTVDIHNLRSLDNLRVSGDTITINCDVSGAPSNNASIVAARGSEDNAVLKWNESTDEWEIGTSTTFPIFSGLNYKKQARFYFGTDDPTNTDRLNYDGYLYATKVYNAVYNDLAEFMYAKEETKPGDVLVQNKDGIYKSKKRAEIGVLGVHSDSFGFALGAENKEAKTPIGLAGKVKVNIKGEVKAGQELVSYKNGKAIKANLFERLFKRNAIIGKALENGKNNRIWMLIK